MNDESRAGGGPTAGRVIEVSPMGNVGNRMIQYMAALALAERVPRARLSRIHLPEWGIQIPPIEEALPRTHVVTAPAIDLAGLAGGLAGGAIDRVEIRSYAQHIDNFLGPDFYREIFRGPAMVGAGPGELLCSLRQGDILDARHPDYVLIPIEFYADLVALTGLAPVFMGQLEETAYLAALRRRFPNARYVRSQGAAADFAFIRASWHIVPSISTFAWLAAWLSRAETIHLPVLGLFNPGQSPATNLLPLGDGRYRFTLFPHHYAVPGDDFAAAHAAIRHLWRPMEPGRLEELLARERPPRDRQAALEAFDEAFYLRRYADIAAAIDAGGMPGARHHFEHHGWQEGREGSEVDRAWYCQEYPIAAIEMSLGEARDPLDHWLRLGRNRAWRPTPRQPS